MSDAPLMWKGTEVRQVDFIKGWHIMGRSGEEEKCSTSQRGLQTCSLTSQATDPNPHHVLAITASHCRMVPYTQKQLLQAQSRLNSFRNCPGFLYLNPLWEHRKPCFPNPEISASGRKVYRLSKACVLIVHQFASLLCECALKQTSSDLPWKWHV